MFYSYAVIVLDCSVWKLQRAGSDKMYLHSRQYFRGPFAAGPGRPLTTATKFDDANLMPIRFQGTAADMRPIWPGLTHPYYHPPRNDTPFQNPLTI